MPKYFPKTAEGIAKANTEICSITLAKKLPRHCRGKCFFSFRLGNYFADGFWAEIRTLLGRKKRSYSPPSPKVGKKPTHPKPVPDVRHDLTDHFPVFTEKRGRCRFCPMGCSCVICNKYRITLCLRKGQNFLYDFHH